MDPAFWRIVALGVLIVVGLCFFRPTRGGAVVCDRCGFATRPGTPACPRCGRTLDMTRVDLDRLEGLRRRGEIDEQTYRRRKLALLRGRDEQDESGGRPG